jgi:hypothetical protein
MSSSPTNWMIFLTYRIRDGADADGYDDWLRSIDNPFFNAIPGIKCYTNWKVHGSPSPLPFTHFDFLEIDDVNQLESLWFNPELNTFRIEWVRLWGRDVPDPNNALCYLCESDSSRAAPQANLVLEPAPGRGETNGAWTTRELLHKHYAMGPSETWRTTDFNDASARFANFNVNYTAAPLEAGAMNNDMAFSSTLIAAPEGFVVRES